MTTEVNFWSRIRKQWPGHWMRIEASNGGVDPGTPDSMLSYCGRGKLVELKVWPEPVSAVQLAWHIDATQRGADPEVWSLLPDGTVWCGGAEAYDAMTASGRRPKGVQLQAAVKSLLKFLQT